MRWLLVALLAVLALVAVGCDALQQPAPSLVAPASGPCAGIPVIPRDQPPDTLPFTRDALLEAKLPTTIDGQPVTDISSGRWVETLCMLGGEDSLNAAGANLPAGLSLTDMDVASAVATVDGRPVTITAFRLPGGSGSQILPALSMIAGSLGGEGSKFSGGFTTTTVAGKSVATWTDPADGSISYLYATGDTLFVVDGVTPSQADKVFAALA